MLCEKLLVDASVLQKDGQCLAHQTVAIAQGRIIWCGHKEEQPKEYSEAKERIDCQGRLLTPGLIDCHTHLVYGGNRAHEFKLRMDGKSYSDIAHAGGGIVSTVRATRAASETELIEMTWPRLVALANEGVTTLEIKSGYGLDLESELKMLRVARRLEKLSGLCIKTSFLGAHTVPPEFQGKAQDYIDFLCNQVLPKVAEEGLADYVDVFCEHIAFNIAQTEQMFKAAASYGLAVKCHAEQLSDSGAAELAAKYGALSCDHLEYLSEAGAEAMASSGSVAVLLPGAFYYLAECKLPPMALLRAHGVGIAIASDANPGSSPTTSLLLMLSMACRFFGTSVEEALSGISFQAARALGIEKDTGSIAPGMRADLNLWSVKDSAYLCYVFASPIPHQTMINGEWVKPLSYEFRS